VTRLRSRGAPFVRMRMCVCKTRNNSITARARPELSVSVPSTLKRARALARAGDCCCSGVVEVYADVLFAAVAVARGGTVVVCYAGAPSRRTPNICRRGTIPAAHHRACGVTCRGVLCVLPTVNLRARPRVCALIFYTIITVLLYSTAAANSTRRYLLII